MKLDVVDKTFVGLFLAYFVFGGLFIVGCILNVIAVVKLLTTSAPLDTMFIGRIIGLFFPPLGTLLGWFA